SRHDFCSYSDLIGLQAGFLKYSHEITLDPNTAHRHLLLSEGNRKAMYTKEEQSYSDHPDRFTGWLQILSRESLTGRYYWEVEWRGQGVEVAVTYKNIRRVGKSDLSFFGFNQKSWSLKCYINKYEFWHNKVQTVLSVSNRVAVYVDCPAGTLSFYRVSSDTLIHLHTFNTTFTEPLCPGFRVWFPEQMQICMFFSFIFSLTP
uniref:B30.2/SPRY domain-containing protein n=1 Tax=Haplochromis burtoni TaxID=8153 RepID=A0A3Q2W2B7_HAPBU